MKNVIYFGKYYQIISTYPINISYTVAGLHKETKNIFEPLLPPTSTEISWFSGTYLGLLNILCCACEIYSSCTHSYFCLLVFLASKNRNEKCLWQKRKVCLPVRFFCWFLKDSQLYTQLICIFPLSKETIMLSQS